MKTNRMLIAIMFLGGLVSFTDTQAQTHRERGFGIGLEHHDSAELITYLARESPLHDVGVKVGDEIIAFDHERIGANDLLLDRLFNQAEDSIPISIRRQSGDTFSTILSISNLRSHKVRNCGMVDNATGYVRLAAFTSDALDNLDSALDSLAKGEDGFGKSPDVMISRRAEAEAFLRRQNPFRLFSTSGIADQNARDQYLTDMNGYISDKYSWRMQTLRLDLRGSSADESLDVLREIRLFCEEHGITLVREI